MLNRKVKKYVYMATHKFESGFTLLSTLFVITVILLLLPYMANLINSMQNTSIYNDLSVHQFHLFLRNEVIRSTNPQIGSDFLQLDINDNDTAWIEQYDNVIRRRVNKEGHEIYLRDVKKLSWYQQPFGVKVQIKSTEGKVYEKIISFYE